MKRIYLIDCPGVVPPSNNDSPQDILLRGVVRVENVENPEQYIAAVLKKTKPHHIERTYDIKGYETPLEFLELLARKGGRLLKGGEADVDGAAKMVLNDFLRGKIPWFTAPPLAEGQSEKGILGRKGILGEMGKVGIPKDEKHAEGAGGSRKSAEGHEDLEGDNESDEGDFEGFGDNDNESLESDEEEIMSDVSDEDEDDEAAGTAGTRLEPPLDIADNA